MKKKRDFVTEGINVNVTKKTFNEFNFKHKKQNNKHFLINIPIV